MINTSLPGPTFGGGHPIERLPGDPNAIRASARAYEAWSGRLNEAGSAVKKVNNDTWKGAAAEAFAERHDHEPKRWFDASDHALDVARALESYAYSLEWAQQEVADAYAEWKRGREASRAGANLSAHPGAQVMWQQQETAERAFGSPPKPAFPGDTGAATRSHALWRQTNARDQLDAAGDDVAAVIDNAADNLPIHRNFFENVGEFFRGGIDNIANVWQAITDPAGTIAAFADQGKLWLTDQKAALENLVDKEGHGNNYYRWAGSMVLGAGVGKAGRLLRPRYLPKHLRPGYFDKYRVGGHAPLSGKSGGDGVTKVHGENLDITPEVRERASYMNPYRMDHIVERHGPDTPYPDPATTQFPGNWSHDKIFNVIQDVASDPNSAWTRLGNGLENGFLRSDGTPARFEVNGFHSYEVNGVEHHLPVRAIVEPYGEGIISGYRPNM